MRQLMLTTVERTLLENFPPRILVVQKCLDLFDLPRAILQCVARTSPISYSVARRLSRRAPPLDPLLNFNENATLNFNAVLPIHLVVGRLPLWRDSSLRRGLERFSSLPEFCSRCDRRCCGGASRIRVSNSRLLLRDIFSGRSIP